MSKSQRTKGASGERELCAILSDVLGQAVKRNLAQTRGAEGGDITVGQFSIECKRRKGIAIYEWLDQAQRDAGDRIPIVAMRADGRRWVVAMDLDVFLPMLQGEVCNAEITGRQKRSF